MRWEASIADGQSDVEEKDEIIRVCKFDHVTQISPQNLNQDTRTSHNHVLEPRVNVPLIQRHVGLLFQDTCICAQRISL
jgi:hypothetical protein